MGSNYRLKYNVDIAMCIDATGSMEPLIGKVRENAENFYADLMERMGSKGKAIDNVRVRVIAFRDYASDGLENAMLASEFFNLPNQSREFHDTLAAITAQDGGDDPEDGLEALAFAIKSDWVKTGHKKRHIIIVWSDDATHPLGEGAKMDMKGYPPKMPRSFEELTDMWENPAIMDPSAKRLIIYAPDREHWGTISELWNQSIHFPSEAGNGLENVTYQSILDAIANSI